MPLKKSQRSLKSWTKQKWRTKSGKPSAKTGERYLPEKAIKALSAKSMPQLHVRKEKTLKKESNIQSNQSEQQRKQEHIGRNEVFIFNINFYQWMC